MRACNGYTLQMFCRLASAGIRGGVWGSFFGMDRAQPV